MTLKNPSDLFNLKKPVNNEEFMVEAASDSIMSLYETFDRFSSFDRLKGNINKIEEISNTLSTLKENISDKVSKSELDAAIFSQLMVMDEIFKKIQSQIKGLNKEDLDEYSSHINGLTEYVKEFTEVEIPKYKKQVLSTELRFSEKLDSYQKIIENELSSSDEKLNNQLTNVAEVIDEQLNSFNTQIQETKNEVLKTSDTYTKLYKIIETKGVKENERLEEYNNILENFNEQLDKFNVEFTEFQQLAQESINSHITKLQENVDSISNSLDEKFNEYDSHLNEFVIEIESDFDTLKSGLSKKFTDIETDVVKVEKHLKDTNSNLSKVEEYIKENHNELISLREEVFSDVSKLPIGNIWENIERLDNKINQIKEAYSKIEPEVIIKQVITEGGFAEPTSAKNSDPLTPLNQNFVTLPQLQQHYRLFLNRIQEQISTIGGGGETQLKYLDDIVGIATNPSAYDGKFLRYNHTLRKFEFVEVTSGPNTGTANYATTAGISTNVIGGIGSITSLSVSGITTLGTVRISSGIITATSGVVTYYGDGRNLTGVVATYAPNAGIATYATSSGIATYAPNAGIATYATSSGIASELTSTASVNTTGIITATSFSGSGVNLSSLNASNLSSGTVPPQRITASSGDFTVGQNLFVNGTLSVGGTSIILNAATLQVADKDIVLGVTTNINGNDVSTDNTANHGGIAIASTEGSPIINIPIQIGVNSKPSTYKQFMWVKQGNYSGMGTDAWVSNYAISIGNTSTVANRSRLTVGTGFTVYDNRLDVNNIFSTGIITASSFVGNLTGTANTATFSTSSGYATTAGISTVAQGLTGNPSISLTNLNTSGISTLGLVQISSGIITATSGIVTYYGDGSKLTGVATTSHQATHRLGGTDVITPAVQTMSDADVTVSATVTIVGTSITFTAPRTLTLPSASTVPSGLSINIIDTFGAINGANTLTILRAGTDTINGGTSISMGAPRSSRQLISNGLNAWSFDAEVLRSSNNLSDVILPSIARVNLGARPPQIDIFTSSGTWTKPTGAVYVDIQLLAGGGGGSSGQKITTGTTVKLGGGGGGGGSFFSTRVPAIVLGSSESVTVGAGGIGGLASSGTANVGLAGGSTIFGPFTAQGGGPAGFPAGASGTGVLHGNGGGVANATGAAGVSGNPATSGSAMQPGGPGGGSGGGITTASVASVGGAGARSFILNLAGGAAGTVGNSGGAGTDNLLATNGLFGVGGGGGGGGSGITTSGGAGGVGGFPSGGGGGGGATETGATSGAGGNGGAGMAIIVTYF